MKRVRSLIRPLVQRLAAYAPGEQPTIPGLIKLNTNENPYPPSPIVLTALRDAIDGRLRLYPNPNCDALRARLARFHHCRPENIFVGNGSDEVLALAIRAFVEPAASVRSKKTGAAPQGHGDLARATVQYFWPSYSLYPVLAEIHGALKNAVPLREDFSLPSLRELRKGSQWNFRAALTLITTPNAPSGRGFRKSDLEEVCRAQKGVVLLDEAYADFAAENALPLALQHSHVLVARTFSKAYSLCAQRIGYCVGSPELIAALFQVKDSYNVNLLGQVAALATLDDLPYYRRNFRRVIDTRERLRRELTGLGWRVVPSEANFLFCQPPGPPAAQWQPALRRRKILVRWFSAPEVKRYLRISVGNDAEADVLLAAVRAISSE